MPTYESHPHNTISWIDLSCTDLDQSLELYSELMGWTTFNDGETPYWIFQNDGSAVGGAMALTPEMGEMPQAWSLYVSVEDADATIAAVTAAGGSVMQPPFDIPDGGKIAVIADPAGAAICLFEGIAENGLGQIDEPGAPCWFDCMSRDVAAAEAFYTSVFGWSGAPMPGPMPYTVFSQGDRAICGMMAMPEQMPAEVPSYWYPSFSVPDANAAVAKMTERGGQVLMAPGDTPFGRAASLQDPWGAVFNVIDRSSATAG